DAGQHTFSATLETAGSQSLTATDTATSSVAGTQAGIVVKPVSFLVNGFPATTTAGETGRATFRAGTDNGTTAAGYTGKIQFTSRDPQAALPADYTLPSTDAGVHTFSATLETAGSQSLTTTDTATSSVTGTQAGILVEPAGFLVNGFPATTTAG